MRRIDDLFILTVVKQWEYQIIDSKDLGDGIFRGPDRARVVEHLNQLGRDGWEIVAADFNELGNHYSFLAIAKRQRDGNA